MKPKVMVKGDPRNIALEAHWDGFNVTGKRSQGCWILNVSILNAGNTSNISLLPVLFILLGNNEDFNIARMKKNISSFLQPFVEELEMLFVEGMRCKYNYPVSRISKYLSTSDDLPLIRVFLMLVTGDHPAQCKIGRLKSSGPARCRRCKMSYIEVSAGKYAYDKNQEQVLNPPPMRTACELFQEVQEWNIHSDEPEKKDCRSRVSGVSGESKL